MYFTGFFFFKCNSILPFNFFIHSFSVQTCFMSLGSQGSVENPCRHRETANPTQKRSQAQSRTYIILLYGLLKLHISNFISFKSLDVSTSFGSQVEYLWTGKPVWWSLFSRWRTGGFALTMEGSCSSASLVKSTPWC